MKEPEILNRDNKHFNTFLELIAKNLDENKCIHSFINTHKAISTIENLYSIDVDYFETYKYLMDNGGYCDCEILMNVDY